MKWHREPLLHFLLLGAGLFALYAVLKDTAEPAADPGRIELEATFTDVLLRIVFADGQVQTGLLKPAAPVLPVTGPRPVTAIAADYLKLGVGHILLGIDHLLFVLGLMLPALAQEPLVSAESLEKVFAGRPYSPYAGRDFPARVYWGDTHLRRMSASDAKYFNLKVSEEVPMTTQERAYTSPIWYSRSGIRRDPAVSLNHSDSDKP